MKSEYITWRNSLRRILPLTALSLLSATILTAMPHAANAAVKFKTLHSFCLDSPTCTDGLSPNGVSVASTGGLYGTTYAGGNFNSGGTIFHMTARGVVTSLYAFCANSPCPDGLSPRSGVIEDVNGALYGITQSGGDNLGQGVIYKLIPGDKDSQLAVLHTFCANANCLDGSVPLARLTYQGASSGARYDGSSPLYGTTSQGGANGKGVAFELSFKSGVPKYKVIYNFCSQADCMDGDLSYSSSPLTIGAKHRLFGTARFGGTSNSGVVFELARSGTAFTETVLYSFCQMQNCTDGTNPSGVTFDTSGNLVGTTVAGGTHDQGTVYSIVPNGADSQETVLYSFCSLTKCADGRGPEGSLIVARNGVLIGTTAAGGTSNFDAGTVFELSGGAETVLHSFCSEQFCTDGNEPIPMLTMKGSTLYGATYSGGDGNGLGGVVFKLVP